MLLRRYGFLLVFAGLFVLSVAGFALANQDRALQEHRERCEFAKAIRPEATCPAFSYDGSSFWDGFWENQQSEMAQLFIQGLVLVALQQHLARKDSENTISDVEDAIRRVRRPTVTPDDL